ncbi:crossover junction endodeoxyribonuclease RuvC [Candidatus Falkowbacteria bacterium RIFCSPLOWO2_12_FULL_45_13]|uniref:Crossover junction endodeoxyribonuclease RuvC n=2 Tax=Candidatus Falkowiibacteriota TaxID=1752728 RepID=A0A1F5SC62_9BACT|nr:MAG: crossover junction endodeoxyribonuclease RuvC [Candidatus Falkowbacteria bacterium RIFCSPLOWO2_02_FULL_45_21]OGF31133.1 MAG: crossover junction endodeoxyribonuclease RuvC [Candidatus Falkowbacteria bacterium RIFCSPLOWO2_12_FULL_45_13]
MQKKITSIILGIDPGIADTGYGVIKSQNGKLACLAYGSIKTSAKLKLGDRLEIIYLEITELIKKYQPSLIAIEELFFCNNAKTALIVGQARGVAVLTAKLNKIKNLEFTPYEVKQAVSTYGHASKNQVQRMIKLILNLKELPRPDDAADALAIAVCAANSIVNPKF